MWRHKLGHERVGRKEDWKWRVHGRNLMLAHIVLRHILETEVDTGDVALREYERQQRAAYIRQARST